MSTPGITRDVLEKKLRSNAAASCHSVGVAALAADGGGGRRCSTNWEAAPSICAGGGGPAGSTGAGSGRRSSTQLATTNSATVRASKRLRAPDSIGVRSTTRRIDLRVTPSARSSTMPAAVHDSETVVRLPSGTVSAEYSIALPSSIASTR
jgi:hypothetical protein